MASGPKVVEGLSLEEFLRLPNIDVQPYLEYVDGQAREKPLPKKKHALIQAELLMRLNSFARPARWGLAFPELRCTFAGRSIVPDVVFLTREHIPLDENGELIDETPIPPDIHIEIISPDQAVTESHEKLLHSTAHGCPLGWLIHPYRRTIDVYRPGRPPERLPDDGVLDGVPVLPGFRLAVAEVFGWLRPDF